LGFTIVLITHEMEVVKQICTKVAVLEHGRIVEEGLVTRVFSYPHHPTTQQFLQSASHETPEHFFKPSSPSRRNVRLRFMGAVAQEPVISVNANILSGWIDHLQTTTIGTLVVELTGDPNQIEHTFHYLQAKGVHYDEC
jgi:D-methionine transport system ATP-binding protein